MRTSPLPLLALVLALPCLGEEGRVTCHGLTAVDGQFIDFENATVLSEPEVAGLKADVQFLRLNGSALVLRPLGGAQVSILTQDQLDSERLKIVFEDGDCDISPGNGGAVPAIVVLTRDGRLARGRLAFGTQNVPALLGIEYEIQHDRSTFFPRPVTELRARWVGEHAEVTWRNDATNKVRIRWWTDGERVREETVEGDSHSLPDLTPEMCYRVEVATLGDDGAGVPSRTSVFSATVGARHGRITADRPHGHGYAVSFRTGGIDEADPDWVPFFWGMRVPPGGGILRLGKGQRLFDETTLLPTRGYLPAYDRFDDGDVLAIRLADGRYAKVLIRPEIEDVRDGVVMDFVFLAMGGHEEPAGPTDLSGELQSDGLHLTWEGCEGADSYRILEVGDEKKVLATVRETRATIADAVRNCSYDLEVVAITASGAEMGSCHARISTWYPWWQVGEVELDWHTKNGYDFEAGAPREDSGDFWVSNSAGGMSSLTLSSEVGICNEGVPELAGRSEVELLDALQGLTWEKEIQTDEHRPESERFAVKTADGRFALVRIDGEGPEGNRIFEFVYLLPLTDVAEMARQLGELGEAVDEGTLAEVRALLPRLDSNDPAIREEASLAIEALPRKAILAIAKLLKEDDLSEEVRARLMDAAATLFRKPNR